jgi:hypothetical protein
VRVVFSDVKLPGGRSGIDLANAIRASYPHIRVLLTSGIAPFPDLPTGVALIRKPYLLVDVERQLTILLAAPPPGAGRAGAGKPARREGL